MLLSLPDVFFVTKYFASSVVFMF